MLYTLNKAGYNKPVRIRVRMVKKKFDRLSKTKAVNIWNSCMCTAVEEMNIESILAVMNTTKIFLSK